MTVFLSFPLRSMPFNGFSGSSMGISQCHLMVLVGVAWGLAHAI